MLHTSIMRLIVDGITLIAFAYVGTSLALLVWRSRGG
jgi:hypothetical protein